MHVGVHVVWFPASSHKNLAKKISYKCESDSHTKPLNKIDLIRYFFRIAVKYNYVRTIVILSTAKIC